MEDEELILEPVHDLIALRRNQSALYVVEAGDSLTAVA